MSHSMSLNLGQKQSLKQAQRLIMSPQMQQALNLLQVPLMELSSLVEAELEQNPVLEVIDSHESESVAEYEEDLPGGADPDSGAESEVTIDDRDFELLRQLDADYRDHFAESGGYAAKRSQEEEKLKSFLESSVCSQESRFDRLMRQVDESDLEKSERAVAEAIVGNLDDHGLLSGSLEELAALGGFPLESLRKVLKVVQSFDPPGIAAGSFQEALLLQLQRLGKEDSLAYRVVENHFEDMLHNRIPLIARGVGASPAEVEAAIKEEVAKLQLHPSESGAAQPQHVIVPDVRIYEEDGQLHVDVPDEGLPPLRINSRYLQMLSDESLCAETKEYIKGKVLSGKWLLRNICQRNDTLYRIAEQLINRQRAFFLHPEGKLTPLTMKVLAEEIGVHESTVARAVSNKYVDSPRGVLPLRHFFTAAYVDQQGQDISATTVKDALRQIIEAEDKAKPLSDEALSAKLGEQGINCARRTVAKYRTQLGVGNASQRRSYSTK